VLRGTSFVVGARGRSDWAGPDVSRRRRFAAGECGRPDYVRKLLPVLHRSFDAVFFHPQPVVAAIDGHAIAGGCVLACCADRRIMARVGGRIGVTELLVGVPFPALAFEAVRFAVPARYLAEFMFGGATYETEAALQRGWVDEVVDADALMAQAMAAAQKLAQLSPAAFSQTKMQLPRRSASALSEARRQPIRSPPKSGPRRKRCITLANTSRAR